MRTALDSTVSSADKDSSIKLSDEKTTANIAIRALNQILSLVSFFSTEAPLIGRDVNDLDAPFEIL